MICDCGRPIAHLFGETKVDADKVAIDDLTRQVKKQSGDLATITRARIDQLKAEVSATKRIKKALTSSRGELLKTLEAAVNASSPLSLLSLDRNQLMSFILDAGLGLAVEEFVDSADRIEDAAAKAVGAIVPNFGFDPIQGEINQIKVSVAQSVFDDVILPDTLGAVRGSLQAMAVQVPVKQAMSALSKRMQSATGRQLTEVRTKLAQYGRDVTAKAAESAGLDMFLYTGPKDGLTREFCIPLINKVVSSAQMKRLNNGQGLAVKTSGGGYNCRHSWSPISKGFLIASKLPRASTKDIQKANDGGRGK